MILKAFAKYLKEHPIDIPPQVLLTRWLKDVLKRTPQDNVERIIHCELTLLEDPNGSYAVVGSNIRGQKLLEVLFNYTAMYETYVFSKWVNNRKPDDFKETDNT